MLGFINLLAVVSSYPYSCLRTLYSLYAPFAPVSERRTEWPLPLADLMSDSAKKGNLCRENYGLVKQAVQKLSAGIDIA